MTENVNILIIDDEDVVIQGLRKILNKDNHFNYKIDFAHSARDGLEKSILNKYDVIVSDIIMPGMDGMELLHKFINIDIKAQIIMFTGYATMKTALIALKLGAFDFIAKPFTKDEFCNSIHRAIKKGPRELEKNKNISEELNLIKPSNIYSIPGKTWAKVKEDHSVLVGVENSFLNSIDQIENFEILNEGEQVIQGCGFGKIFTKSNKEYTLQSPLSGRILFVNNVGIENLGQQQDFSNSETWLIHLEPKAIENEVSNLVLKMNEVK